MISLVNEIQPSYFSLNSAPCRLPQTPQSSTVYHLSHNRKPIVAFDTEVHYIFPFTVLRSLLSSFHMSIYQMQMDCCLLEIPQQTNFNIHLKKLSRLLRQQTYL